jgi:hypothetical protein
MESVSAAAANVPESEGSGGDKGLKNGTIGYLSNLVIGMASTAPAFYMNKADPDCGTSFDGRAGGRVGVGSDHGE